MEVSLIPHSLHFSNSSNPGLIPSISGFFWQAMIHSPASIPIGNETDGTRDNIFRHCTRSLTELYFPPIEAIDKVQIARSATSRTDRQLARQGRFRSGSKGGCLFMPHSNPLDFLAHTHCIRDAVERIAHHAINSFHTGCGQNFHK